MFKGIAKYEQMIAGKAYHFFCDQDSPLSDVKNVLCDLIAHIKIMEDQQIAAQKQQAEQQEPAPDLGSKDD